MTTSLDHLLRERQETWEATRSLSEQADKRADKAFTPAEQRTWDARNADLDRFDRNIAELQGQSEQQQRAADASRGAGRLIRPDTGTGTAERTASGHTLLSRSDSFAQHAGKLGLGGGTEDQNLSLGRYLRGFVTGQWEPTPSGRNAPWQPPRSPGAAPWSRCRWQTRSLTWPAPR